MLRNDDSVIAAGQRGGCDRNHATPGEAPGSPDSENGDCENGQAWNRGGVLSRIQKKSQEAAGAERPGEPLTPRPTGPLACPIPIDLEE